MYFLLYAYWISLSICCGYAVLKGKKPEQTGAAVVGIGSIASALVASAYETRFVDFELGLFIIDVAVLFILLKFSLFSERYWPLWMTGFHLVAVATHTAILIQPQSVPTAYALAQGFWAYPMMLSLFMGTAYNHGKKSIEHCSKTR